MGHPTPTPPITFNHEGWQNILEEGGQQEQVEHLQLHLYPTIFIPFRWCGGPIAQYHT